MSGHENPATVKARNARPGRRELRSAQGNMWQKDRRDIANGYRRKCLSKNPYTQMIDDARDPLIITSNNIAITSDWHVPFYDNDLVTKLFHVVQEYDTKDLIIAGDLWDCDNYSRFVSLTEAGSKLSVTFTGEVDEVKKVLRRLLEHFDHIYICRGNHEKRWIDLNAGKMGMKELFALARPSNMSEDEFNQRVHITLDDHVTLFQKDEMWLCCHPRNFRITPLSVARDLSAKHLCNVIGAHGHAFNSGRDRSGHFRVADGGGMFERAALDYTRETTCHPMTRSGFYLLKDGVLMPFEGET